jgi:hypothetical protein
LAGTKNISVLAVWSLDSTDYGESNANRDGNVSSAAKQKS